MLKVKSMLMLLAINCMLIVVTSSTTVYCYDTCFKAKDSCESYSRVTNIFSGKLLKIEELQYSIKYTFRMDKMFKGKFGKTVRCLVLKEDDCFQLPLMKQDMQYLVFVYTVGNKNIIRSDKFFETKLLKSSDQALQQLRKNKEKPYLNSKTCNP